MKIKFWTKRANRNTNNCYCDYYLKDKAMMEELGVETNNNIEYEINNGDFSCLIDTLGDYETIMHKYRITSFEQLEKAISFYFNAKKNFLRDKGVVMESEKVKEIKKSLEFNANEDIYVLPYVDDKGEQNIVDFNDILTLIKELESKNERLSSIYRNLEINYNDTWEHYREYEVENAKLKDRIALLEKDNEVLRNAKVIYETVDYCAEDLWKAEKRIKELETKNEVICVELSRYTEHCIEMKNGTLKQFAERLKEKVKNFCGTEYENAYYDVTKESACEDIDETLKEFINGVEIGD